MSRPPDLVQGTLDLLILKILALGPRNGWAIGERLTQISGVTTTVARSSTSSRGPDAGNSTARRKTGTASRPPSRRS